MKLDLEVINFHSSTTKKENKIISMNERRVELLKKAEQLAEELYGDIPYHNFEHAIDAVESGYELIAKCQASGIEVDSDLVRYSLLFHDAGYHRNHEKEGFNTKEEYSAYLAEKSLRSLDIAEETIENVKKCIISTHKDNEFNKLEEKIVRAADLVGLAGDYDQFRENAIKLREEVEIISGNKVSWEDWKKKVVEIIGFYLEQDINLTKCYMDKEGKSIFHSETKRNLERFMQEDIMI